PETDGQLLSELAEPGKLRAFAADHRAATARHFIELSLLPMVMRALFGEYLTAPRTEIAPHVARTVAFFLAACRQGGIGWTKRQRRQKQGSRTCFVSCCKSHRSRPAVFLFRDHAAARRSVSVAYVA